MQKNRQYLGEAIFSLSFFYSKKMTKSINYLDSVETKGLLIIGLFLSKSLALK